MLAPIVVSVYDRLEHLRRCVESLQMNKLATESVLYVVSDAAYKEEHIKKINEVREFISSIKGFKEVKPVFREKNLGAHLSLSLMLKEVLQNYDSFIFLEDDIVVSNDFLQYLNDGLVYYREQKTFLQFVVLKHRSIYPLIIKKTFFLSL